MPAFCDVALPVPLDQTFTYAIAEVVPVVGARVLVPFSGQRLMGVVTRLHDDPLPEGIETKPVQQVLDSTAILSDELMRLAAWIAQYYVAPLGEVLRGMLPLAAEVKRHFAYRIAEPGRKVLYQGAEKGSSRRSKLSPEEQNREYAVLNYLEDGAVAKASALRSATQANKSLLDGMVRKKWLLREAVAEERDARRLERIAVLVPETRLPKLNENQTSLLAEIAAVGGRMRVADIRHLPIPESTLNTLLKRNLVTVEKIAEEFFRSATHPAGKLHTHQHPLNEAQLEALSGIVISLNQNSFRPHLLYGITGSGKTAVYFAAMQRVLDSGRSALLLVPEIGLTPAMSGQMYAAFGGLVALLHSQLTPDERAEQWHRIRRGEARIVVGTRSAVFAPITNLGLIIVDEEHDSSYKQEETPRYHGRDVAVMRAKFLNIPVVLGSATPSLESWSNARKGRYTLIEMRQRVANRPLPTPLNSLTCASSSSRPARNRSFLAASSKRHNSPSTAMSKPLSCSIAVAILL